jgi:PPOX class probable F420-dependent enzyme
MAASSDDFHPPRAVVRETRVIVMSAPAEVSSMATKIPDTFLDLLTQKKAYAHLATVMPDGSPQVTPVWFDYEGGKIRVNTARGRVKDRNMTQNARVALSIIDPDNPYRHLAVRGRVAKVTEEGADDHIDALAHKYLGQPKYPMRRPGEVRVIYEIEPASVSAMG